MKQSGRLYRIMSFNHVVQLFEKGELHFSHPSIWSDPHEVRLRHANSHQLYGQCWCTKGVSDAMWRIYSPSHLGVRISTSTGKLRRALEPEAAKRGYDFTLREVSYLSQNEIEAQCKRIQSDLTNEFDMQRAIDALYLKRDAFDYESEYRAVISCQDANKSTQSNGVKVAINPFDLIDSILLDPRAPDELAAALAYYFKEKIRFQKNVRRSALYKSPTPFLVK